MCGSGYIRHLDYPRPAPEVFVPRLRQYEVGTRWPDDWLPEFLFYDYKSNKPMKLPDVFQVTNRLVVVSERLAAVLSEFDLGQTRLHRMELRYFDEETPDGRFFHLLNIGEQKHCFVPEATKTEINQFESGTYWISAGVAEMRPAVLATAAEGVDLWMDPRLKRVPFFSDRLARAIKAGKFGRTGLRECEIVQPH